MPLPSWSLLERDTPLCLKQRRTCGDIFGVFWKQQAVGRSYPRSKLLIDRAVVGRFGVRLELRLMLRLVEKAEMSVPRRAIEDEDERNNTMLNATAAM